MNFFVVMQIQMVKTTVCAPHAVSAPFYAVNSNIILSCSNKLFNQSAFPPHMPGYP